MRKAQDWADELCNRYCLPSPKAAKKKKHRKALSNEEKAWLSKVAALGCCVCKAPANVHHIRTGMGMGQRNDTYHTLPLCHFHHQGAQGIHTLGTKAWQAKYGSETDLLAKVIEALNVESNVLDHRMGAVMRVYND
jgi:hypothetical protein